MTRFRKIFLIFLCLMLSFFCLSAGIVNVNAIEEPDAIENAESKGSTYTITIPQTIMLDENGFAEYQISVTGDLSSVSSISVITDETFELSSFDKENITATVSQDKTVWTPENASTNAQGSISADLTAGVWNGVFNFNVSIEEKEDLCQDGHTDSNNDGKCDICGEDVVNSAENETTIITPDEVGIVATKPEDVVCDLPPDESDENIPAEE